MSAEIRQLTESLIAEVSKVVVGKELHIRLMASAILAEGHILLDDLPGVGKTTLVKTLALALGCRFARIQFTPDLLPSDVVGMNIFDRRAVRFAGLTALSLPTCFWPTSSTAPSHVHSPPSWRPWRSGGHTGRGEPFSSLPFAVLATQNPVESESTFRLPSAQLDRFMLRLSLGYPTEEEEARMLSLVGDEIPFEAVSAVSDPEELSALQLKVRQIAVSTGMTDYIVSLTSATRNHPALQLGASPAASRALFKCAKALAAGYGRAFVTPDDIRELAVPVLAHRLTLSAEARRAVWTLPPCSRKF